MLKTIIFFFMATSIAFCGDQEFNQLNDMRAEYGLYALRYDEALNREAEKRAQMLANRGKGIKHMRGIEHPEGTSNCGSENACYSRTERWGSAGAATVGNYSLVVYGNVINSNGWIGQTTIGGTKENPGGTYRSTRTSNVSRRPLRQFLSIFRR